MTAAHAFHPWRAFALLAAARFMVMLDLSIVMLALPAAQTEFHATAGMSWPVTVYAVVFGGFLLAAGKAADLWGQRRVFLAGLALFTAASLAGGLAQNLGQFVAARAFQGLGAALLSPTAFALVLGLFERPESRRRAVGLWSAVSGVAVPLGGLLGGLLVATTGWRWVMEINVPVGAAALALTGFLIPRNGRPPVNRRLGPAAPVVTAGIMGVVFVLSQARGGWPLPAAVLAASLGLLAVFAFLERRTDDPLIPLTLTRDKAVLAANVAAGLSMAGFVSFLFALTFFLQKDLGLGPVLSGALLLPTAAPFIAGTQVSARVAARIGPRSTLVIGSLLMVAGFLLMTQAGQTTLSWPPFLLGSVLVGCFGLAMPVLFLVGAAGAPKADQGVASGLLSASQQIGAGAGVALSGTFAPPGVFVLCAAFLVLTAVAGGLASRKRPVPAA